MRTELGKINKATFGMGGYDGAMIGISFDLGGSSWGVFDFWGDWGMKPSPGAQWTEAERNARLGEMVMRLKGILDDAKVERVDQLVGKPVEATFDGHMLKSWRVLTEVI